MKDEFLTPVDDFIKDASTVGTLRNARKLVGEILTRKPWIVPAVAGTGGAGAGVGAGAALFGTPMMTEDTVSEELGMGHGSLPLDPSKIVPYAKAVLKATPWILGAGTVLGIGSELGKGVAGAIGGGAKRLYQSAYTGLTPDFLDELLLEDEVISNADPDVVREALHTMQRFAPSLAADKPSVRTFLREAATSGSGVNFNTVKLLSEAEQSVQKAGGGF